MEETGQFRAAVLKGWVHRPLGISEHLPGNPGNRSFFCLFHGVDIRVVSAKVMVQKAAVMLAPIMAVVPNRIKSHSTLHYHTVKI